MPMNARRTIYTLILACALCASTQTQAAEQAAAPLFSDIGNHNAPITTAAEKAQQYFNQGLMLTYGFNHAEAVRSFRAAQAADPACAMCFWGEAYALGPNINKPMADSDVAAAFSAASKRWRNSAHCAIASHARACRTRLPGRLGTAVSVGIAGSQVAVTPSPAYLSRIGPRRRHQTRRSTVSRFMFLMR